MKRIIIICMVLCGTLTSFAQTGRGERSTNPADTTRYLETKLGQNWFISADGSINWWQGSDRNPVGNYSKLLNGPTYGGGIAVGKWITHKTAFRLAYDVNRSHSYIDGRHNGGTTPKVYEFLYDNNPAPDANGYYATTFMYHNLHGDLLLSPIDIIQNYYNSERIYTPIPFIGMGIACVSGHASMIKSLSEGRNFEFSADAGLINQFRINKHLDVSVTLMWTAQRYNIDTWFNEYGVHSDDPNRPRVADFNYSANAGLTWYIGGRIYELPYKYVQTMKETIEIVKLIHDTIPCPEQPIVGGHVGGHDTISEMVSYPMSIFFYRDKHELMSRRDRVNLQEIANVVKEKGWKVHLRGSCDSATATAEYNEKLAQRRCNTIMNILIEMGVPEELIELEPVGGVKELDPTEYDRRVLITLGKKINN